ncbi:hypothetical protein BD309DRAFT_778472, partial [Dichomitus squalens]
MPSIQNISNSIVRGCFGVRLYRLGHGNWWLPAIISAFSLFILLDAAYFAAKLWNAHSYAHIQDFSWALYTGLAAESAVDLIVAISQCVLLRKFETGIRSTDSVIRVLMTYSINTGLLTSFCAIGAVASFAAAPRKFIYFAFYFALSKLYVNSLLATLNARGSLLGKGSRGMRRQHYKQGAFRAPTLSAAGEAGRREGVSASALDPSGYGPGIEVRVRARAGVLSLWGPTVCLFFSLECDIVGSEFASSQSISPPAPPLSGGHSFDGVLMEHTGGCCSSRPSSPPCPSRRTASSGRPRPRSALRSTRSRTAYRTPLARPRVGCTSSLAAAQSLAFRVSLRVPGGARPRLVPLSPISPPRRCTAAAAAAVRSTSGLPERLPFVTPPSKISTSTSGPPFRPSRVRPYRIRGRRPPGHCRARPACAQPRGVSSSTCDKGASTVKTVPSGRRAGEVGMARHAHIYIRIRSTVIHGSSGQSNVVAHPKPSPTCAAHIRQCHH